MPEKKNRFFDWNNVLRNHFFNRANEGRAVFLFVTDELIQRIEKRNPQFGKFIPAVKKGPPGVPSYNLPIQAKHIFTRWRSHFVFPPYFAYLALFVLAAGREGDFADHAYYPRLRQLLGESPQLGMLPGFDRMWELWEDLERWANIDKSGQLGLFHATSIGGWVHIGYPLSQVLLNEVERQSLPIIFSLSGYEPSSPPPDLEISEGLRKYGADLLRPRTLRVLQAQSPDEVAVRNTLVQLVRDELLGWDGVVPPESKQQLPGVVLNRGTLRLAAKFRRLEGIAQFYFRCRTNAIFPPDGLRLTRAGTSATFSCEEAIKGWSSEVIYSNGDEILDASIFDWTAPLEMTDDTAGWALKLRPSPARLFVPSESVDLNSSDWVEVFELQPRRPFFLASHQSISTRIEEWGKTSCQDFAPVPVHRGLPSGWNLYHAKQALDDTDIRNQVPVLAFPNTVSISLQGGIRIDSRLAYFSFGLPKVAIRGAKGGERLYCNGVLLEPDSFSGIYNLVTPVENEDAIRLEVRRDGESVPVDSRYIYVESEFDWRKHTPTGWYDGNGFRLPENEESPKVSGALVDSDVWYAPYFSPPANLFDAPKITFIGSTPGQIVDWPSSALSVEWSPVWAIMRFGKSARAVYCGSDSEAPIAGTYGKSKLQKRWIDVVYHERKKIKEPASLIHRRLWRQYQEFAHHAKK